MDSRGVVNCREMVRFWNEYHNNQFHRDSCLRETVDSLSGLLFSCPNPRVLEIGCGAGHNLPLFAPFASAVYGCDVSNIALRQAEHYVGGRIRLSRCHPHWIPLANETFDLIILSKVLSTLADGGCQFSLVNSIHRLLRLTGKLLLLDFVHNQESLGRYASHWIGRTPAHIISPSWSSISFVHFRSDDFSRILFPMRRLVGYETQLLSCHGRLERGYAAVFQKLGGIQ